MEDHLRGCEACARIAGGLVRTARALGELRSLQAPLELEARVESGFGAEGRVKRALSGLATLERLGAPQGLAGRVVAVCQAGFRAKRAVDGVQSLENVTAPAALDERIETLQAEMRARGELPQAQVSQELDQRVKEGLSDLPRTVSRSLLSKLARRQAPAELLDRVHRDLLANGTADELSPWRRRSQVLRSTPLRVGLGVAAALVLWIGLDGTGIFTPNGGAVEPSPAKYTFLVEHPADLEALSPASRTFGSTIVPGLNALLHGVEHTPADELRTQAGPSFQGRANTPGGSLAGTSSRRTNAAGGTQNSSGGAPGGGSSTPGGSPGTITSGVRFGPQYLNVCGTAPSTVSFRGDRRVLTRTLIQDILYEVDYREEVVTDGAGSFTINPLAVLVPPMDFSQEADFLFLQAGREGFIFRHRDFLIRDQVDFWDNYEVTNAGQMQLIAGRSCERFDIERKDGTGDKFSIAIDPLTSLILFEERRQQNGEILGKTWYETFELNPDLSSYQLTGGPSAWIEFDPSQSPSVFNQEILIPSAPPTDYELQRAGYQASVPPTGLPWAQFIYGDGVEEVFFLSKDPAPTVGNGVNSGNSLGGERGDSVRVYTFGQWTMIEGDVDGRFVLSIGRVHEQELLLMLQSAVE